MEDRSKFRIKKFKVIERFVLEITFEDGKVQTIDFGKVEHKGWWKALENKEYFDKVVISPIKNLEWPEGQDFKPEHLYNWALPKE